MPIKELLNKNENSKLRESLVEYMLLERLIIAAGNINKRLEISRSDQDLFGYDVVLKIDDKIKFIQLKSSNKDSKTNNWDIQKTIINNENASVILLLISYPEKGVDIEYRLLNDLRRNSIVKQQPRHRKDNEQYCSINYGDMIKVIDEKELLKELFRSLFHDQASPVGRSACGQ